VTGPLVVDLAHASADAGGKAAGLARLWAAGLPVPPGFALTSAAFRVVTGARATGAGLDALGERLAAWAHAAESHPIPPALEADVVARSRALAVLGGSLIVRSSMAIEDGVTRAAPGVGRSIDAVAPDDVWTAIRAVWVASLTPMVAAYARRDGVDDVPAPGVVVQRAITGERLTVYTRPPGRAEADEVWLGHATRSITRRDDPRPEVTLALAAERAIAAPRGADVELVREEGGAWFVVQARPLVHPAPRPRRAAPPSIVLAPLRASGRRWRRDVTHNPAPLSTAQTELCNLVERAGVAPFHLAVVAGFLYDAPRDDAGEVASAPAPRTADELDARVAAAAAAVDEALAVTDELDRALVGYLTAYAAIVRLAPAIAAARAVLVDRLVAAGATRREAVARAAELAPRRPSSLVSMVAAAARGEIDHATLHARAGHFAPAWDVASPTFAETPALLDDAIARARARPAPPPEPDAPRELADEVALARAAADAAERDDALFAHAQATVRRALLATAARLGLPPEDVFWLPFDELRSAPAEGARGGWTAAMAARASAARAAAARSAGWDMPLVVGDPFALSEGQSPESKGGMHPSTWRGDGLGGRAAGPAARLEALGATARLPRGAVVVTPAVTPAMALMLEGVAAIVCEHGSLLDHGPAMARELGVPCVVGCAGFADTVIDGEWLEVDGDAGTVRRAPELERI